jgi:hypothetical protein
MSPRPSVAAGMASRPRSLSPSCGVSLSLFFPLYSIFPPRLKLEMCAQPDSNLLEEMVTDESSEVVEAASMCKNWVAPLIGGANIKCARAS